MFSSNVDLEHWRLSLAPIFMLPSASSSTGAGVFIIWSGKATPPKAPCEVTIFTGPCQQEWGPAESELVSVSTLEPTANIQLQISSRKVSEYSPRWTFYLLLPLPMLIWMLSNNKKFFKIRLKVLWIVSFSRVFMKWESFTLFPYFTWHSGPYILLNEHKITL